VLGKRPDRAREALEVIEQTSSQALREMRTILGVLRDADDGRVPHPGLGQIGELATRAREAGLDIDLEANSAPPPVPVAVGSAVYRILQESITNVIRHVGPTRVTVELDYGPDTVAIRVTDEGPRQGTGIGEDALHRPARGILGMRERCQLLGGELDAGPRAGGGFAVTARLPLAPTGAANG
jgi:signal transduction histidine kinase